MWFKITSLCKIHSWVDFATEYLWNIMIREIWKCQRGFLIMGANYDEMDLGGRE